MKLQKYIASLLAVSVLVAFASPAFSDDNRRDGNWWQTQAALERLEYVVGFLDGMDLGRDFSVWKYSTSKAPADIDTAAKTYGSYDEFSKQYLHNVTVGQIVAGLDTFYADYRNRRIQTRAAVWLVLQGIAGVPAEELNKNIENWRRNAAN